MTSLLGRNEHSPAPQIDESYVQARPEQVPAPKNAQIFRESDIRPGSRKTYPFIPREV